MAASITFDFISRGGPALAADFKRTGDNAAAAARGAKVLSDVIKDLGQKEDRTAAESATLARALKLTGDAEDRAAAKALAADIAIRRLDDSLKDSGKNAGSARGGFLGLAGEITGLGAASDGAASGGSKFKLALAGLNLATGIAEPAVAALAVSVGAVAAGAVAAGIGLAGFSAVAQSQITPVTKAMQDQAAAVKGGAAAQKTYAAALKALTPVQRELLTSLTGVQAEFKTWSDSLARPVLTPILAALKLVNPLLKDMSPFVLAAASAIGVLVGKLSAAVNSTGFQQWLQTMLPLVKPVIVDLGVAIGNIVTGIGGMLAAFAPFTTEVLGGLDALTKKFAAWGTTLSSHSGFNAMIAEFKQNWPLVRTGLGELATIVKNILSAMAGLATGANSKALWEVANPLLALVVGLSAHPAVVRDLLYLLAAIQLAQKAGGVVSLGVKVVGAGQKILDFFKTGTLTIGAAGMQTAGDTMAAAAAAMQKAADTMVGADAAAGKGGAAGAAAGGAKIAAPGAASLIAGGWVVAGGIAAGLFLRGLGDALSPKGTFAGQLNAHMQALATTSGGIFSTNLLHSFTFGGLEAKLTTEIGLPVGSVLNNIAAGAKTWGTNLTSGVTGTFSSIAGGAKTWWGNVTGTISSAWNAITGASSAGGKAVVAGFGAAGAAADALRTRNLVPLQGEAATVSGGIQGLAGIVQNTLSAAMQAAGRAADAFRTKNLVPLSGQVGTVSGGIQGLQGYINALHGKNVTVGVTGTGSGGVVITTSGIAAAGSGNVRFVSGNAASGAYITQGTGPRADDVLARVSKGELVVPAGMVAGGAVDHLRGHIPGFAAGGFPGIESTLGGMAATSAGFEGRGGAAAMAAGIKAAIAKEKAALAAAAAKAASTGAGTPGPGGGAPAANAALARKLMPAWASGAEWNAWNTLEMHEAGWNQFARNPSSGAYGIPQALPPSKMGAAANPPQSNPTAQINWMVGYIKSVYGDPIRAWAQYYAHPGGVGWYDQGGMLPAGLSLAYNGTGRPEQVIPAPRGGTQAPAGQQVTDRLDRIGKLLERLIGTTAAVPAATGRHVGGAIGGAAASASFRSRYPRGGA